MNLIKFSSDTKYRKQFFTGLSFSHPAKMHLSLQLWLIENFTKEGETILDPMAGSGTILVACSMGRNVITVELEDKFVQMQKGNWEKIKLRGQLGYQMGTAIILQGDSRNLTGILADKIITSPPYTNRMDGGIRGPRAGMTPYTDESPDSWFTQRDQQNIGNLRYGEIDKIITSPQYGEATQKLPDNIHIPITGSPLSKGTDAVKLARYSECKENLGNLPYGSIDAVISSPPYEGTEARDRSKESWWDEERETKLAGGSAKIAKGYQVDAVISSPPYENQIHKGSGEWSQSPGGKLLGGEQSAGGKMLGVPQGEDYIKSQDNIGNLKSDFYLSAMLQVYQQCYQVLKDSGLMVLVTKNFIRNKQQVRLDLDTIKLCEQAGFTFQDRWYRELANQSFWRTIYHQKYPEVEPIKFEDILVFGK